MNKKLFGWEMDKNIGDFSEVSKNMREEGHQSRADVIDYLIARVMVAEETTTTMIKLHKMYKLSTEGIIATLSGEEHDPTSLIKAMREYGKG